MLVTVSVFLYMQPAKPLGATLLLNQGDGMLVITVQIHCP